MEFRGLKVEGDWVSLNLFAVVCHCHGHRSSGPYPHVAAYKLKSIHDREAKRNRQLKNREKK